MVTDIDARSVVVNRTLDVLDRVTAVTYPDATLNVTYTYDTGPFGKGRLTGIARHGETLAHTYDRFGRLLQDGTLTYEYDKNGNRTKIIHPDSVTATYDHDFADREDTLTVQVGANPPLQLVNDASYEPFGPLSTLVLGNGLIETRTFDDRYAPSGIQVDGTGKPGQRPLGSAELDLRPDRQPAERNTWNGDRHLYLSAQPGRRPKPEAPFDHPGRRRDRS